MKAVPEVMEHTNGLQFVVLVCGDRAWGKVAPIQREILALYRLHGHRLKIVHGACARKKDGRWVDADMIADTVAHLLGIPVQPYPADWDRHGNSAGPIRNVQMLQEEQPNLVLAFHANIERSKGTRHMATIAIEAGVPVKVFKQ